MSKIENTNSFAITAYNPLWPTKFEQIKQLLLSIFPNNLAIEHIGSTSVPGMSGKDLIDFLIIVDQLEISKEVIAKMESHNYNFYRDYLQKNSALFILETDGVKKANIHVFQKTNPHVAEMLLFRDFLKNNPDEVKKYSELKLTLFKKYPNKYSEYRKNKNVDVDVLMKRVGVTKQ